MNSPASTLTQKRNLSRRRGVWLVARREIKTRALSKPFIISTALFLVAIVAGSIVLHAVRSTDNTNTANIGVAGNDAALIPAVQAAASAVHQDVRVTSIPNADTGRADVRSKSLDAYVASNGDRLQVTVRKSLNDKLNNSLAFVAQRLTLDRQISQLGGNPTNVNAAVASSGIDVVKLQPPKTYNSQRLAIGSIAGVLIYMALMITGQMVAQGVVEEKASRVVEVLLATIRPAQLMAGKVLGIGVVGLIQVAILGIAGVLSASLTGALSLSFSVLSGSLVWLLVWFLLGYALYSLAFAAVAATVSRQEDVGSVIMPIMSFLIAGYVVGISVLPANPGNNAIAVMSIIPVFSPTLMPMRLAMGHVPIWQTILSVALVAILIPSLTSTAGTIYRRAIIRTGARVKMSSLIGRRAQPT
jgi:ABC-2 type transport system permease protein